MFIPLQHLAASGNQQVNDMCVDGMNANEHKVGNFRMGEDTAADIQGQTTQSRNPLYDVCKGRSLVHCLKQGLQTWAAPVPGGS